MFVNDLDLLLRLKTDDVLAFKVILNKYYPRLYYFILEFIPQEDIADNIVYGTFYTLWNVKSKRIITNTTICKKMGY